MAMFSIRSIAFLAVALLLAACTAPGATTRPSAAATTAATSDPTTAATIAPTATAGAPTAVASASPVAAGPICDNLPAEAEGDLLAELCDRDNIVAFTDPAYPPQSELNPTTGEYEGFDIDVTNEIAERLGIATVEFTAPDFDAMQAGSWAGRYDIAVGSVTVTETRKAVLDFTQPYYFTPAQLSTHPDSGITTVDGFAGETICVGEGTTYFDWLEGTLTLTEEAGEVAEVPAGAVASALRTDTDCALSWQSGRRDFDGWLTAAPTAEQAIEDDYPVELVGDPVFFEPLAVAFDKSVENNDVLVAEVDRIIGEMHSDGTLTALSEQYYGIDITQQ
jgi:polar amino acid transport system substrate-binding protein